MVLAPTKQAAVHYKPLVCYRVWKDFTDTRLQNFALTLKYFKIVTEGQNIQRKSICISFINIVEREENVGLYEQSNLNFSINHYITITF